jgi:hypothetical protein
MSQQTASGVSLTIEWDDGVVIVFSFTDPTSNKKFVCGFPHIVPAWQSQTGTQTQVSTKVQNITTSTLQISGDPATWVETVKYGSRAAGGSTPTVTVVYDDSTSVHYTTEIATSFDLYQLFAIYG